MGWFVYDRHLVKEMRIPLKANKLMKLPFYPLKMHEKMLASLRKRKIWENWKEFLLRILPERNLKAMTTSYQNVKRACKKFNAFIRIKKSIKKAFMASWLGHSPHVWIFRRRLYINVMPLLDQIVLTVVYKNTILSFKDFLTEDKYLNNVMIKPRK